MSRRRGGPRRGLRFALPVLASARRPRRPRLPRALVLLACFLAAIDVSPAAAETEPEPAERLWEALDAALAARVDAEGFVEYAGLLGDTVFVRAWNALTATSATELASWPEPERLAFWINAYNFATLRLIADHYPIEGRFPLDLFFPDNSILMIPGRWENGYVLGGAFHSLDAIEHQILRKEFREPRIHFAIVCASRGCPLLRSEAYRGSRLDAQLEEQALRYFSTPAGLRLEDARRPTLRLSRILDWFGEDFDGLVPGPDVAAAQEGERGVLLARLARWFPPSIRERLARQAVRVEWIAYDWSLNER